jgi:hypothetical protein
MKPIIIKKFADNGDLSHWSVINHDTGEVIIEDIIENQKILSKLQELAEATIWKDQCDVFRLPYKVEYNWKGRRRNENRSEHGYTSFYFHVKPNAEINYKNALREIEDIRKNEW